MFDDKTDSKSKWVKKLMFVLSGLSSLFVKISIYDALLSHNLFSGISKCVMPQLKELE